MTLLAVAISVVPALALLGVFLRMDAERPEPRAVVLVTLALGALACVPTALAEGWLHAHLGSHHALTSRALTVFGRIAGTEEALKLAIVLAYPFRHRAFDEHMDGLVYAAASGLGFALLENAQYAVRAGADAVQIVILRGVTAVPAHAIAGGLLGYFVGLAKFSRGPRRVGLLALALGAGVAFHGVYDWVALSGDELQLLELFLVLAAGAGLVTLAARSALRRDEALFAGRTE